MQRILRPWPSAQDLTGLVAKAGGSFAFATALIQYVGSGSHATQGLGKTSGIRS